MNTATSTAHSGDRSARDPSGRSACQLERCLCGISSYCVGPRVRVLSPVRAVEVRLRRHVLRRSRRCCDAHTFGCVSATRASPQLWSGRESAILWRFLWRRSAGSRRPRGTTPAATGGESGSAQPPLEANAACRTIRRQRRGRQRASAICEECAHVRRPAARAALQSRR